MLMLAFPVCTAVLAVILLGERMTGFAGSVSGWLLWACCFALIWILEIWISAGVICLETCSFFRGSWEFLLQLLREESPGTLFANGDAVLHLSGDDRHHDTADTSPGVGCVCAHSALYRADLDRTGLADFFSNYLSMVFFLKALKQLDAIQAALSNYLITFFGLPIAAIWLRERLSVVAIVGGILVLAGTLLITCGKNWESSYVPGSWQYAISQWLCMAAWALLHEGGTRLL